VWNNYYAWSQMKVAGTTALEWNGCVESRKAGTLTSAYNINDTAPVVANPETLFPVYLNPDAYGAISSGTSSAASSSAGYSYIPTGLTTATSGNECAGLTTTICTGTTTSNKLTKQENYRKYTGAVVGLPKNDTTPLATNIQYSQYVGPWGGCAVNKIVSLTHDRSKVENGVKNLRAHGITVIPEGLAWGLRVLSPTEPFTKVEGHGIIPSTTIAPYKDARWQKVMVLMTDGDNNVNEGSYAPNNSGYSAYGLVREVVTADKNRFGTTSSSAIESKLTTAMKDTCEAIKAQGISLYVTSFGNDVSSATRADLLSCSSGTAYYQHNTTAAQLKDFFLHIGKDVLSKSIYVSK
jgi:hypothetical protein